MVSAMLAITSIEAFCNTSIPDNYQHPTNRKSPDGKAWIEEHYGLDRKLKEVLPSALKKPNPSNTDDILKPYERLKLPER